MNPDKILSNYDYDIPAELIAQKPVENRQSSKLFVVDRKSKSFSHKIFHDISEYFNEGDTLVINTTKVVPSRLFGKKSTGGKVELLFLDPCHADSQYKVLMKPFLDIGKKIYFQEGYECEVVSKTDLGEVIVRFNKTGIQDFLQKYALMPLPPYINRKGELADELSDLDRERYQTVYAQNPGAIAAPTAGLHFTDEVIAGLKNKGVNIASLTLHVGWGTFKPIIANDIDKHNMMSEKFSIDAKNTEMINTAIRSGKKVAAVGTTSTRALESLAFLAGYEENGKTLIREFYGETSIFIYPGYEFKIINTLITNLHLPKSTPLMMASAFASRELMLKAYSEAVREKYRFFSYGDSMLIL